MDCLDSEAFFRQPPELIFKEIKKDCEVQSDLSNLSSSKPYDHKVDIYSMGILLIELIQGTTTSTPNFLKEFRSDIGYENTGIDYIDDLAPISLFSLECDEIVYTRVAHVLLNHVLNMHMNMCSRSCSVHVLKKKYFSEHEIQNFRT